MNNFFDGVFTTDGIMPTKFLLCLLVACLIGCELAFIHRYKNNSTASFRITLAMLPSVVAVVIMMVNGNLGAGVAVAGAFSLVRFRSIPGTAREIGSLFVAMASGLIIGMGYVGYALLFAILVGGEELIFTAVEAKCLGKKENNLRILRITIPEDLNIDKMFEDLFEDYTEKAELKNIKTTNMGSMYKLTYEVVLKNIEKQKNFMDDIRCRNGNLEVSLCIKEVSENEL